MLRFHCVRLFYNLRHPGMEASRIRGGRLCSTSPTGSGGPLACGKTTLNFRRLPAKHKPGQGLLEKINAHPKSQGLKLREGTIVGAAIIDREPGRGAGPRDATGQEGNHWRFGMKAQSSVDRSGRTRCS